MGPRNVRRLTKANVEPKTYPNKVLGHYRGFYQSLSKKSSKSRAVSANDRVAKNQG